LGNGASGGGFGYNGDAGQHQGPLKKTKKRNERETGAKPQGLSKVMQVGEKKKETKQE